MGAEPSGSHQQRIITSEQWVFDRAPRDEHPPEGKARRTPLTKEERDHRRRQRELENEQLQNEYNAVRQENAKLKSVVARLRQDIDAYARLLAPEAEPGAASGAVPGTAPGAPTRVPLEAESMAESCDTASARDSPTLDLFPSDTSAAGVSMRAAQRVGQCTALRADGFPPLNSLLVSSSKRRKRDSREATETSDKTVGVAPTAVGPEEIALMRRLKDVLAEME
ncbi:LAMI_0G05490g1_1 [Lachancea mirantina]|uniref:LAMI_0G05490g1_1 n=1 Tax=Lachancea mirantina TaxID=1230905 RepID=A0A1G4K8Z2_9SACH|nr:LAMI_0G05490g1_1 [Lachancea mirantina]